MPASLSTTRAGLHRWDSLGSQNFVAWTFCHHSVQTCPIAAQVESASTLLRLQHAAGLQLPADRRVDGSRRRTNTNNVVLAISGKPQTLIVSQYLS